METCDVWNPDKRNGEGETQEELGDTEPPEATSRKKGGKKGLDLTYSEAGDGRAGGKRGVEGKPIIDQRAPTYPEGQVAGEAESEAVEYGLCDVRDFPRWKMI